MSRQKLRGLNFERLEDRRLLAADFGAEVIQCEFIPAEVCVVEAENLMVEAEEIELGDCEPEVEDIMALTGTELRDPVLGTSGYFGELNFETPSKSMTFTPSENGTIDAVIALSFGASTTNLEITDSCGNPIESILTQPTDGFEKLTFDVVEGESYQLTVSTDEFCEGQFMVTVDFSKTPIPVDFHADEIGTDSTKLEFNDGMAQLAGELEFSGDIDTFRLTADADGKAMLQLAETLAENATELNVSVYDAAGDEVARGITNESVMVSFDVTEGCEYFVAIDASHDQMGAYQMELEIESIPVESTPVDLHAHEIGDQATLLTLENGQVRVSGTLETAEDRDAFRIVASADGEMVVDVKTNSDQHTSDASVSVFGPEGELMVSGGTNEQVAIRFDSYANVE